MDIVSWTLDRTGEHEEEPVSFKRSKQRFRTYLADKCQLYIDANDASRYHSCSGIRTLVRQLVGGFHHHGLNKGDCVCVVSLNDVSIWGHSIRTQSHWRYISITPPCISE